jgi:hypothetical protein
MPPDTDLAQFDAHVSQQPNRAVIHSAAAAGQRSLHDHEG